MNIARLITRFILSLPQSLLIRMAGSPPLEIDGRRLDVRMHFIGAQGAKQRPQITDTTPEQARKLTHMAFAITNPPREPRVDVKNDTIQAADGTPLAVRHYRPQHTDHPIAAILYFHMGGWVIGDLDTCDSFCSLLATHCQAHVVSLDYRLAPEHKFPQAMQDSFDAYEWLRNQGESLKINVDQIAVGGDSAGGCMTATLCQEMKRRGVPQPKAQMMIYPATDLTADSGSMISCGACPPLTTETMNWFGQHWLNEESERTNPLASPALGEITSDLAPALIITAGFDPLRDQGAAYAEQLRQAGVHVHYHCEDSLAHAFTAYGGLVPRAAQANAYIAERLRLMLEA